MNERIKELAEQAWDATAVSPEFGHPVSFAEKSVSFVEKFAELIIKECCSVLYDNEMGGYQVEHCLKDHFGVE